MACVVHNCRSTYSGSDVTLHRFPKDPHLRQTWIEQLSSTVHLSKNSKICSKHFEHRCFWTKTDGRKMLIPSAVPTIFEESAVIPRISFSGQNNSNDLGQDASTRRGTKRKRFTGDFTLEDMEDREVAKMFYKAVIAERKKLLRENKKLKLKNGRLENRIKDVTAVLEQCQCLQRKKNKMKFVMTPAAEALIDRMLKNPEREEYSPELKCFASSLHFYSSRAYEYVRKTFSNILPCPRTITNWSRGIDGDPGITEEVSGDKKIRPCSCKTSNDNTLHYPELKVLLPPGYSYHVCEWTDLGTGCFDTIFRVNVPNEDTAYLWLKEFQTTSRSEFYRDKTWTHNGITIMFKVKKSVYNTAPRNIDVKHTNCSAKLLITIKETHKRNCQSPDIHLPAYPMIVTYRDTHRNRQNHQLKNSDNVEATTKPFVHFFRSAEENDPSSEIVPPISDPSDDKSEVLKATENLIVEPDFSAIIVDQFEVDDSNSSDDDTALDNIEHTSETQKTNISEIYSLQQIKVERTEI